MQFSSVADLDLRISGGLVVDGVHPPKRMDIGVRGGHIVALAQELKVSASRVIDASGLVVSPGFIDAHSHGDLIDFYGPEGTDLALASLRQGVTTQIVGNCGFSVFAAGCGEHPELNRHVAGLFGDQAQSWANVSDYRAAVTDVGLHMNLGTLLGHGSLRSFLDSRIHASPRELALRMRRHVSTAVRDGAFGLSTGLVYWPGTAADIEELIVVSSGLRGSGCPYVTHIRGETHDVLVSIREALDIARRASVPLHISHHKVAGRGNWGRTIETLGLIDEARDRGMDVTLDVYPYTAASTSLHTLLPSWLHDQGWAAMLERLRSAGVRQRLAMDIERGLPRWENMLGAAGWRNVRVAHAPGLPAYEGLSLAEIGQRLDVDPLTATLDLQLKALRPITVVFNVLDETDVSRVLSHPGVMIGSDGIPLPGKPHPRWAGSFSRVLGRYVRERAVMTISEAVMKMSILPARRFQLPDRGRLAVGAAADLVIFSPDEVVDRATFDDPLAHPAGVAMVLVNGVVTVEDNKFQGVRAGRFLEGVDGLHERADVPVGGPGTW